MKSTIDSLFGDLLTAPIDARLLDIYVLMNTIDFAVGDGQATKAKTILYKIGPSSKPNESQIKDCEILSSVDGNIEHPNPGNPFHSPDYLSKFLKSSVDVKDEHEFFFVTWGHGSAFGIFRETNPRSTKNRVPVLNRLEGYPYLSKFYNAALKADKKHRRYLNLVHSDRQYQFWAPPFEITEGLVNDSNVGTFSLSQNLWYFSDAGRRRILQSSLNKKTGKPREILANGELAQTFKLWLGPERKISVLLMMNCWMFNLHTMYSLQDSVVCLVGAQSDIGVPGYNYRAILKFLSSPKTCSVDPIALARKCVESCETNRMRKLSARLRSDGKDAIDRWKIFGANLQFADSSGNKMLANQINALKELIELMNEDPDPELSSLEVGWMYKFTRAVSFDFSAGTSRMVDIMNWILALILADQTFVPERITMLPPPLRQKMIKFRDLCLDTTARNNLTVASTKASLVYGTETKLFEPNSAISFEPKGFSTFFPLFPIDPTKNAGLLDNLQNDQLLAELTQWKDFLKKHVDASIDF